MNWKGTRDGKATCTFSYSNRKSRAVRNDTGLICQLVAPVYYSGQHDRYEKDLEEAKANQELIADAFNTIQIFDRLPSQLLAERNEAIDFIKGILEWEEHDDLRLPVTLSSELKSVINKIEHGK